MNRLERLTSILVQLQSKPIITAQEIATRFNISLRTVYRDIKSLEESGIPLIGNTGLGYSLVEGYKLSPLMFTEQEAIAFLTAEKILEKITDTTNAEHFKSGMYKVRTVLRNIEKDYLSHLDNHFTVLGYNHQNLPTDITQNIFKSISTQKAITIDYFSGEKQELTTNRNIEPIGCFYSRDKWYLIAYCQTRQDYRNFRIDRIKSYKLSVTNFTKKHLSLTEYIKQCQQNDTPITVILRIQNTPPPMINELKTIMRCYKEIVEENHTDYYFQTYSPNHFARWYLTIADFAEIISPSQIKEIAKNIYNNMKID